MYFYVNVACSRQWNWDWGGRSGGTRKYLPECQRIWKSLRCTILYLDQYWYRHRGWEWQQRWWLGPSRRKHRKRRYYWGWCRDVKRSKLHQVSLSGLYVWNDNMKWSSSKQLTAGSFLKILLFKPAQNFLLLDYWTSINFKHAFSSPPSSPSLFFHKNKKQQTNKNH